MPAKGPRARLPRLIVLLAQGCHTEAELAGALDTDGRTLRYDLNAIEEGGIEIERIQSSGGERAGRQPTRYRLSAGARELLGRTG